MVLLSQRLEPGRPVDLAALPTRAALGKADAIAQLDDLHPRLEAAHERLWAGDKASVLLLLQGMDTAGKDRIIRRVCTALIPQALDVHAFGPPSAEEARYDFLRRYHTRVPAHGRVGVFNRTWYESVLVERVDRLVGPKVIEARFAHLLAFEQLLADHGTVVLKVYLHLSKEEQASRLEERREHPGKQWKHNPHDLGKHKQYDAYLEAYRDALARTSTATAPWHVVPADHKPTRDLAVAELLLAALKQATGTR